MAGAVGTVVQGWSEMIELYFDFMCFILPEWVLENDILSSFIVIVPISVATTMSIMFPILYALDKMGILN